MAAKTYKTRALVLHKTKLGEKDVIVSLLAPDGSLVRAVAKGARKPGGSHASKVEQFSTIDALLAQGRSLDVLCDGRLAGGVRPAALSLEQSACMAPVAELVLAVAQPGLPQPRLFDLACASLDAIAARQGDDALALCAAALWKVVAQAGFRPAFDACIACGEPLGTEAGEGEPRWSALEGGAVCASCAASLQTTAASPAMLSWGAYMLQARYDAMEPGLCDAAASLSLLSLAREWVAIHVGRRLRSLDFLFTSGLFRAPEGGKEPSAP